MPRTLIRVPLSKPSDLVRSGPVCDVLRDIGRPGVALARSAARV